MSINIFCNVLLERETRFVDEGGVVLTDEAQMNGLKAVSRDVFLVLGIAEDEAELVRVFYKPRVFLGLCKFSARKPGEVEVECETRLVVTRAG